MWERNRPNIKRYFARVQMLDSFRAAITLTEGSQLMDLFTSPVFLGILGTTAVLAGGYYLWSKKGPEISSALTALFSSDENSNDVPIKRVVNMNADPRKYAAAYAPLTTPTMPTSAPRVQAKPSQFS